MSARVAEWMRLAFAMEPGAHLRPGQFAVAALMVALAAAFWGLAARHWFVAAVIAATELHAAWITPAAEERPWRRAGRLFVMGAMWAAIGMIVFGNGR